MNEEKSPALIRAEKARQRSLAAGKNKRINDAASRPDQQPQQKEFHAEKTSQEYRTKRFQMVFKPSLFEKVKKRAEADNVSINEFITQLLEKNV